MDIDKIEETIQNNSQKNTIEAKGNGKKGSPSGLSNQSGSKASYKTWLFSFLLLSNSKGLIKIAQNSMAELQRIPIIFNWTADAKFACFYRSPVARTAEKDYEGNG